MSQRHNDPPHVVHILYQCLISLVEHECGYLLTDLCFKLIVFLWIVLCIEYLLSSILDAVI